jgi:hypothetical protein
MAAGSLKAVYAGVVWGVRKVGLHSEDPGTLHNLSGCLVEVHPASPDR